MIDLDELSELVFRLKDDDRIKAVAMHMSHPREVVLSAVKQREAATQLAAAAERMLNHTGGMSRLDAEIALKGALEAYRRGVT
jgi:hypothetical protein